MSKNRILGYATLAAGAIMSLTGCQADMDTPALDVPVATIQANTSIRELKEAFDGKTELVGLKDEGAGTHYVIHGRVISSDATGNIYKSLVIQDETAALAFSINQGSMYVDYRLGQDVVVDVTGLYMGYYRGLQQVGFPGDPYDGEPQLGFMAYDYWLDHAQKNGLPDNTTLNVADNPSAWPSESMYCIQMSLPISTGDLIPYQSQLVELRNVHFQDGGKEIYAPHEESVSRTLLDDNGQSIIVRNSGYSNFWNKTLPAGKGNVRGILSYYSGSWQLLIRDLSDVMIDEKGSEEKPYSVTEAMNPQMQLRSGWIQGYVVGSVKAGVSTVTGNNDVIFGADAEMDNNVLIAAEASEKDWSKCMVVELPQKTLLRNKVNLADNPGMYGKLLNVEGTISTAMGIPAITDSKGGPENFSINGQHQEEPTEFTEIYHGLKPEDTTCDFTFDITSNPANLTRVWSWRDYNDKYYLNGSAYSSGAAREAVAYAISPVIDLTGKSEAKASFRHAAKFQTTLTTLCGFAVREQGTSEWQEFPIPVWPSEGSWTFTGSGDIDISAFAGKKVEVAFKYGSSSAGADTWEINDLIVSAR